jgi:hypothetical protein
VKKSPRDGVTFETVRRTALSLPNVEEGTAWGLPAFRTGGNMFSCFREDLDSIVVRASLIIIAGIHGRWRAWQNCVPTFCR